MKYWIFLFIAIFAEILGTSSLKLSQGFTNQIYIVGVALGYLAAFIFLGLAFKEIPMGIGYAIWSGVGTIGAILFGTLKLGERLSLVEWIGIALILIGTVVIKIYHQTN